MILSRHVYLFIAALLFTSVLSFTVSFSPSSSRVLLGQKTSLFVSIGLGPGPDQSDIDDEEEEEVRVYEIPNHEEYRTSRRSKLDIACDQWLENLLDNTPDGILGEIAVKAREKLTATVELVNDIEKDPSDEEWTPYVQTRLPWTPLVPAYGLEQFGLPSPRRNAETWRQFDVPGMVAQDYTGEASISALKSENSVETLQEAVKNQGTWLDDDACTARLVYINGYYCDELSKPTEHVYNVQDSSLATDKRMVEYLSRLTDGFTDELVVPVPNGDSSLTSFKQLSGPDHCIGEPTSQFAINTQQGTACFAAMNTIKTKGVAYVHAPAELQLTDEQLGSASRPKPVLIINAITPSAGSLDNGAAIHPRTLVIADDFARLSLVQSTIDLLLEKEGNEQHVPKLYNGYTQMFVNNGTNVTHSYLEESGGTVTAGVEVRDASLPEGETSRREIEAARPELLDTHLEAIDVHVMGENAEYQGTVMSMGGSGRVRIALSATLLQPGASAHINGFSLSGGAQRTDMKTCIHHIAQGTISRQAQKNMIGGRATGAFRGRIRVEQSAQQTDSQQLARTVLLSDSARTWAIPSLEIIADDVKCTHGTTVSDLSEEELFYLRSRGLGRSMARNLLMYAFAGDIAKCVDPAMLGGLDSEQGLQKRTIRKLENLVPQGERAVKGEFQSI